MIIVTPLTKTTAWKCPVCKRVMLFESDIWWVICGGGWVDPEHPELGPLHPLARGYEVPLEQADPIDIARWTGMLDWLQQVKLWQVAIA